MTGGEALQRDGSFAYLRLFFFGLLAAYGLFRSLASQLTSLSVWELREMHVFCKRNNIQWTTAHALSCAQNHKKTKRRIKDHKRTAVNTRELGQVRFVTWAIDPLEEVVRDAHGHIVACTAVHPPTSSNDRGCQVCGFLAEMVYLWIAYRFAASWNLICCQHALKKSSVNGCQFHFSNLLVTGSPKMVNKA